MMLPSPPRLPIAQLQPKGISCCNIPFLLISLFLALAAPVSAQQQFVTDEDRSRFVERFYNKAEPGLRSPAEYIEIARKAAHSQYGSSIPLSNFSDGMVTYRKYRNAPKADQEIIAVAFVYQAKYSGGGFYGSNFIYTRADPERPILLVLMRRDLSKIYVNVIHFKAK
jgi:hypothetical protein